jgi:AraC-like DNA-binding protein
MQAAAENITRKQLSGPDRLEEIVQLAPVRNNPGRIVYQHRHADYCEIMLIEQGEGTYTIEGTAYRVCAGDIAVINAGAEHIQQSNPQNPVQGWNLDLRLRPAQNFRENQLIPDSCSPILCADTSESDLRSLFHSLYRERVSTRPESGTAAFLWCRLILLEVSRLLPADARSPEAGRTRPKMEDVKNYLEEHYRENISLDDLAARFYTSKYYLAHKMKEAYGISPINYLVRRRIGEAQSLLGATSLSTAQIGAAVGYPDPSYFIRIFRRYVGLTPEEFRKKTR